MLFIYKYILIYLFLYKHASVATHMYKQAENHMYVVTLTDVHIYHGLFKTGLLLFILISSLAFLFKALYSASFLLTRDISKDTCC